MSEVNSLASFPISLSACLRIYPESNPVPESFIDCLISSIDFVFTHQLLNYLDDDVLEKGISEIYRIAGKYIMNCERYDESEKQIDGNSKFRNMQKRWLDYKVKIVSNVDMHEEIDPNKSRFTLLRKL